MLMAVKYVAKGRPDQEENVPLYIIMSNYRIK